MAKLPKLIEALAEVDERPRSTLEYIARTIREGGELPTIKRGSGAADMTVRDAANFLIGASVAEASPKDAPKLVRLYRALSIQAHTTPAEDGEMKRVATHISKSKTFGDALERLIEASPLILSIFIDFVDAAFGDKKGAFARKGLMRGEHARVQVSFIRPAPGVIIRVEQTLLGQSELICEWKCRLESEIAIREFLSSPSCKGDASSSRTVGLRTLLKLFIAVASEESIEAIEGECGIPMSVLVAAR
jgi:hypothetical protein